MGVMACSRTGCENIMCDRYSSEYGYLCNKCFDDLVATGAETNIAEFMGCCCENRYSGEAEARYSAVFKL